MDLKEVMQQENFVVIGDTLNEEKYAYKIKKSMEEAGYNVWAVGKELASINDVKNDIDVMDLCINSKKGLELIKACEKKYKMVVIQPGAESVELLAYMKENNIPYIESCLLVGLKLYKK